MRTCCNRVSPANTLEKRDKILRRAFAVAASVAVLLVLGCSGLSRKQSGSVPQGPAPGSAGCRCPSSPSSFSFGAAIRDLIHKVIRTNVRIV